MNLIEFLKTIYVGDRGCKSILIDGWNFAVKFQVTCISRVRSGEWNYYTDEDLEDGYLVFEGVKDIAFDPSGPIPNDQINYIRAEPLIGERAKYLVVISIDSVDMAGKHTEIKIRMHANSMFLEDNARPGYQIVE